MSTLLKKRTDVPQISAASCFSRCNLTTVSRMKAENNLTAPCITKSTVQGAVSMLFKIIRHHDLAHRLKSSPLIKAFRIFAVRGNEIDVPDPL